MTKEIDLQRLNLEVPRPPLACDIVIGKNILTNLAQVVDLTGYTQFVVVTEPGIHNLYGQQLTRGLVLTNKPIQFIETDGGESNKTETEADRILTKILNIQPAIDRRTAILALGGGVVGDMTGYIAGRCLRGIDYLQIPTTLLAMVDSSLGGKTAVDHEGITNMIGLFHLPRATIMDVETLTTLPNREWQSGLAELVKHGFLDLDLWKLLSRLDNQTLRTNQDQLIEVLRLSSQFKMSIVSQDFEEKTGVRKVLNFGHTIGRALEAATNLSRFTHGEAVSIGMTAILLISHKQGLLTKKSLEEMLTILKSFDLPMQAFGVDKSLLWQAMRRDKKAGGGIPRFVLLEGIGQPKIDCQVEEKLINEVLGEIFP